jgi:hypothetical protein
VPAAAVIPAPIAYTKVVAVKKLVVEIVSCGVCLPIAVRQARLRGFSPVRLSCVFLCAALLRGNVTCNYGRFNDSRRGILL